MSTRFYKNNIMSIALLSVASFGLVHADASFTSEQYAQLTAFGSIGNVGKKAMREQAAADKKANEDAKATNKEDAEKKDLKVEPVLTLEERVKLQNEQQERLVYQEREQQWLAAEMEYGKMRQKELADEQAANNRAKQENSKRLTEQRSTALAALLQAGYDGEKNLSEDDKYTVLQNVADKNKPKESWAMYLFVNGILKVVLPGEVLFFAVLAAQVGVDSSPTLQAALKEVGSAFSAGSNLDGLTGVVVVGAKAVPLGAWVCTKNFGGWLASFVPRK